MLIRLDKKLYDLKYAGLVWFEKLKEGLEARYFFQSQVYPCVWYKEYIVLLFYVDECLMLGSSKDTIDEEYASLQEYFNIEDDGYLNKLLGIEMERRPDVSIHIRQPYLTRRILSMIPGMDKLSSKSTLVFKPPLAKNEGSQAIKMTLSTYQ